MSDVEDLRIVLSDGKVESLWTSSRYHNYDTQIINKDMMRLEGQSEEDIERNIHANTMFFERVPLPFGGSMEMAPPRRRVRDWGSLEHHGRFYFVVCVPRGWTDEQVLEFGTSIQPDVVVGIPTIRRDGVMQPSGDITKSGQGPHIERAACPHYDNCVHIILDV